MKIWWWFAGDFIQLVLSGYLAQSVGIGLGGIAVAIIQTLNRRERRYDWGVSVASFGANEVRFLLLILA